MLHANTQLTHPHSAAAMFRFAADHPEYITGTEAGPWRMQIPLGSFEARRVGEALLVEATGVNPIGLSYLKLIFVDHIREYRKRCLHPIDFLLAAVRSAAAVSCRELTGESRTRSL